MSRDSYHDDFKSKSTVIYKSRAYKIYSIGYQTALSDTYRQCELLKLKDCRIPTTKLEKVLYEIKEE
jgi:hypothetical protein